MLMIRFQRTGRRNDPAFRVAVTEKRSKPKSGGVELLGSYHPKTKVAVLNAERIVYWLSKGARATPTVHNLLVAKGVVKSATIPIKSALKKTEGQKPAEAEKKA